MSRNPDRVLSPPKGKANEQYTIHTTCCQYCIVGCGYEVHVWEPGQGSTDPPEDLKGNWVSPAMTNKIRVQGREKIAAVLPDPKCPTNKGNHSVRGGTVGRNLTYSQLEPSTEGESTRERLKTPMVRLADGQFRELDWDEATDLVAALIRAAAQAEYTQEGGSTRVTFKKPGGLGVKAYGYQFLENTYLLTKLLYQLIGTPNVAEHDRPSRADSSPAFRDAGINPFAFSYDDVFKSDVIFIIGCNPYENQSILFMQYMTGKQIICMDPRRHLTADYAVKTGGIHLQARFLGADSLVLSALAKYIVDNNRHDAKFIKRFTAKELHLRQVRRRARKAFPEEGPDKFRRERYAMTFDGLRQHLNTRGPDGAFIYSIENAAKVSGIPAADLIRTAEILSDPAKRVSIIYEKGLIWGYNYQNIAGVANLGLLLGSVMRPDSGITGRAGGHQIGWAEVQYMAQKDGRQFTAGYPFHNASDRFDDGQGKPFITHHNLDAHLVGDAAPLHPHAVVPSPQDVTLYWAIGCNPAGQINNSQGKWRRVRERQQILGDAGKPPSGASLDAIKQALVGRIQAGGLVIIDQDIYPNYTTEAADVILPAAGWGEEDFSRWNGERRLRIYSGFQDPPAYSFNGDGTPVTRCLPDWRIFQAIGQELAKTPDGSRTSEAVIREFSYNSSAEVFDDLSFRSNQAGSLRAIVEFGRQVLGATTGPVGHRVLKSRGTAGLLLPTRLGQESSGAPALIETPSIHNDDPANNPFFFVRADWLEIEADFLSNRPRDGEIWITNGRVNETWNNMFTHIRNEFVKNRYPNDMPGTILELNPEWAQSRGISSGDVVRVTAENIHLGASSGFYLAVASLQESIPEGGGFALFSYPHNRRLESPDGKFPFRQFTDQGYNNNVTTGYIDPVNPIGALKYARARLDKVAPEEYGRGVLGPLFAQRNIALRLPVIQNPADEFERARWQMRELIVTKGLPRLGVQQRDERGQLLKNGKRPHFDGTYRQFFADPDRFIEFLESPDGALVRNSILLPLTDPKVFNPTIMHWRDESGRIIDQWSEEEHAIVRKYVTLFEQRSGQTGFNPGSQSISLGAEGGAPDVYDSNTAQLQPK